MATSKSDAVKNIKKHQYKRRNVWDVISKTDLKKVNLYSELYLKFLDASKTEREAVDYVLKEIDGSGYKNIHTDKTAEKVYYNQYGKSLAIFRTGSAGLTKGLNIIVAHLDSPRLDLKQNPLYEDQELALLKTHYYGGVKKYQWLSRPLAMHGVVILQDGRRIDIVIGEKDNDPVFTIADLLPHLAGKAQMTQPASEFIPGEKLNLIVGSMPITSDIKEDSRFKLNVLKLLNEKYGICEEDFISADLEIVPAVKARDIGFDRSLVAGYGQDDRVCSYAAYRALLDAKKPKHSALILLMDKEEIGSEGATGANTWFVEMVLGEVLEKHGIIQYGDLRRWISSASCLSADVNGAVHPDWQDVHEKMNAAYLNAGLVLSKFTGIKGKSGSNEANAEFVATLRNIFNKKDIVWHIAELGKVDEGGGGTIAKFMAYYGMQVIDAGVPVLDMHSPFEITSKGDIWMMYKAFTAFLENN